MVLETRNTIKLCMCYMLWKIVQKSRIQYWSTQFFVKKVFFYRGTPKKGGSQKKQKMGKIAAGFIQVGWPSCHPTMSKHWWIFMCSSFLIHKLDGMTHNLYADSLIYQHQPTPLAKFETTLNVGHAVPLTPTDNWTNVTATKTDTFKRAVRPSKVDILKDAERRQWQWVWSCNHSYTLHPFTGHLNDFTCRQTFNNYSLVIWMISPAGKYSTHIHWWLEVLHLPENIQRTLILLNWQHKSWQHYKHIAVTSQGVSEVCSMFHAV